MGSSVLAAAAVALVLLGACQGPPSDVIALARVRNARKAAADRPRPTRLVVRDPLTGALLEDSGRIDMGSRGHVNDGVQRTWYPGGAPRALREFHGGEPTGHWITWWRTGVLQSSYRFDPDRPTPMVWWHANGLVAAEGPARMGQRTGHWVHFWEHGAPRSEGDYAGGRREGEWVFYDEDGRETWRGRYVAGRRVGEDEPR